MAIHAVAVLLSSARFQLQFVLPCHKREWMTGFQNASSSSEAWHPALRGPVAWWRHCRGKLSYDYFFDLVELGMTAVLFSHHHTDHILYVKNDFLCEIFGRCLRTAFGIDPDDRLCIAFPQVDPLFVKFDFDAVNGIHRLLFVFVPDLCKDMVNIHFRRKLNLILRNEIRRIR